MKNDCIALIGMAGVGKSIAGRKLAERLGCGFVDTDDVIREKTGLELQQVIDRFGDERFREIEERAVLGLKNLDRCVISPGGSVIYSEAAMRFLKDRSIVVYLNASFESIRSRLRDHEVRGIVGLKKKGLRVLFEERLVLYRSFADIEIDVPDELDADVLADEIARRLRPEPGQ